MAKMTLESVELDGNDGVFVAFSDGTTAGFVVEELLELRPCRESLPLKVATAKQPPQISGATSHLLSKTAA